MPRPGNVLSTVERRWVAAMTLNTDMGPIMRLPSLEELPAAALGALRAPRPPLSAAGIRHQTRLLDAQLRHALLCLAAAERRMSLIKSVSLQHVTTVLHRQRPHAPQPWEEHAQRWLWMEGLVPKLFVRQADRGRVVVLEGTGYWSCGRLEHGGLDCIMITADKLLAAV